MAASTQKRAKPASHTSGMRVYFAAPLFSAAERDWNATLAVGLRGAGHEVFLPQEQEPYGDAAGIFASDLAGIEWADGLVAIMTAAIAMADYTGPEADNLCYAIRKKKEDVLRQHEAKFKAGAKKKGIPPHIVDQVFAAFEPFARYGFNKAHATCYGLIAYQTAYLKANYPIEFMHSARAIATRCFWPPERRDGYSSRFSMSPTTSR